MTPLYDELVARGREAAKQEREHREQVEEILPALRAGLVDPNIRLSPAEAEQAAALIEQLEAEEAARWLSDMPRPLSDTDRIETWTRLDDLPMSQWPSPVEILDSSLPSLEAMVTLRFTGGLMVFHISGLGADRVALLVRDIQHAADAAAVADAEQ